MFIIYTKAMERLISRLNVGVRYVYICIYVCAMSIAGIIGVNVN